MGIVSDKDKPCIQFFTEQSERCAKGVNDAERQARHFHRDRRGPSSQDFESTPLKRPGLPQAPLSSLCPLPTSRQGGNGTVKVGGASPHIFMSPASYTSSLDVYTNILTDPLNVAFYKGLKGGVCDS